MMDMAGGAQRVWLGNERIVRRGCHFGFAYTSEAWRE